MKKIYQSKFGRNKCTAAQYITEVLCERKAEFEKRSLPLEFWNQKEWRGYYMYQLKRINSLIKEYGDQTVLSVVLNNTSIFSIYNQRVPMLCLEWNRLLSDKSATIPSFEVNESSGTHRFTKKGKIDNL